MTIGGVDISIFGLVLSYVSGHLDQPARKDTLEVAGFEAKDIVFEAKEITITLIGSYSSSASLSSGIESFKTLIRSNTIHEYILIGHNLTFSGSVMEGIKIDALRNSVKVTFKITTTS